LSNQLKLGVPTDTSHILLRRVSKDNFKAHFLFDRCENQIGRHSKSIDTSTKACGRCRGKLELLASGGAADKKPTRSNPFASYVKNNYKEARDRMKSCGEPSSHRDVMKALSEQFRAASLS